jgi:hypothetical protein
MSNKELSLQATVVATPNHSSADLGAEVAILDLDAGIYYSVDRVGSRIWELLQEPRTVAEICQTLRERYDVSADRCEIDVLAFLTRLVDVGLVTVVGSR